MRVLNKSTVLGTTLVALAILNFSVLDQIGVGLVDSVNATFEDLGAEWMGVQAVDAAVDTGRLADELAAIPGVRTTVEYWSTSVVDFGTASVSSPRPGAVLVGAATAIQWVMVSESYDLSRQPHLFVFEEESETQARFYLDAVAWIDGAPPGPGEVGLSTDMADEHGVRVGDVFTQRFGATPFSPAGVHAANYTVSGIYQRAYTDPAGNPSEVVVVGPDPALRAAPLASREVVVVQAALADVLRVAEVVVERAEAMGYAVSTEQFQAGFGQRVGGPGGGPGAGGGGFQAPGGQATRPDLVLHANGEVLASALDAAGRAGAWFRMLTASAVVLAVLGIAFVTAAMERKVRRDVGIRQAVGYPVRRIYLHWATVATLMGLAGAAVGVGAVYAVSTLGLSHALLGLDVSFRSTAGVLLAPVASVLVYALATLPTYARVLRSSPAQNLRVLSE